jgi:hypothetical protein
MLEWRVSTRSGCVSSSTDAATGGQLWRACGMTYLYAHMCPPGAQCEMCIAGMPAAAGAELVYTVILPMHQVGLMFGYQPCSSRQSRSSRQNCAQGWSCNLLTYMTGLTQSASAVLTMRMATARL